MTEDAALLLIATSELDSNLYYATRFLAPDPFVFLQVGARTILLMSDLEIDRARAQARVDEVLSLSEYEGKARQRWPSPHLIDTVGLLLEANGVQAVTVPSTFPLEYGDRLREKGIRVATRPDPFFPERLIKSEEEIAAIEETQRHTEAALDAALALLRESRIKGDQVLWRGKPLSVEDLKKVINVSLMENDCVAQHTIVACGLDGVDPHNQGAGPIRPHESIVFDIFPRSSRTCYFADMTRTVVKGKASDRLRRMYDAVLAAQLRGIELVRDGGSGQAIHEEVARVLKARGFETGPVDGRMQGFFHGTGHGVGLDIHEPPRISRVGPVLKAGQVVTVEPGLYYSRWGAVRIEDLVVVEAGGCRNLTRASKLELLEL
ncbi:MAG: aminopeptidase P family protein [Candidatus Rokubacteria bacterium]|nr:aminopeptidase P family protein [Candidatus Rokubacteria bacterium]